MQGGRGERSRAEPSLSASNAGVTCHAALGHRFSPLVQRAPVRTIALRPFFQPHQMLGSGFEGVIWCDAPSGIPKRRIDGCTKRVPKPSDSCFNNNTARQFGAESERYCTVFGWYCDSPQGTRSQTADAGETGRGSGIGNAFGMISGLEVEMSLPSQSRTPPFRKDLHKL